MEDYPVYNTSVALQVGNGTSPMAAAYQQSANVWNNFAQKTMGIAQKEVDNNAAKESVKDAQSQGLGWTPKSNMTTAGRAYNQAGRNIAINQGTSQIVGGINKLFSQQITAAPGQDNLNNFTQNANQYYEQQIQNVDPSIQPSITRAYKMALSSDSMQIAKREGRYQVSKSTADLMQNGDELANQAANSMRQATSYTDPVLQNAYGNQSHSLLTQAKVSYQQAGVFSGNFNQSTSKIHQANINFLNATALGKQNSIWNLYNNANSPETKDYYGNQLKSISENFLESPGMRQAFGSVSPEKNMSSNDIYRLQRELNRNSSSFGTQVKAQKAQDVLDANNAITAYGNGSAYPTKIVAMMQTNHPELAPQFMQNLMAAGSQHSLYNEYTNGRPLSDLNTWITKYSNPNQPLVIDGLGAAASEKVKTNLLSSFKTFVKQAKNDPYEVSSQSPEFTKYLRTSIPKLHSNNSQISDLDLQNNVHNVMINPMNIFTKQLSKQGKTAINNIYNYSNQIQSAKGLPNSLVTNANASYIASQINQLPDDQKLHALQTASMNLGTHWGLMQKSLINTKKIPYGDFIAMNLMNNPNVGTTVNDMMDGQDSLLANKNQHWNSLNITQAKAMQDVMSDPTLIAAMSSFNQYPGSKSNQAIAGITNAIANVASTRFLKNGSQWESGSNIISQASKDVINGLYQNSASDGTRVPYTVKTSDSEGNITRSNISLETVNNLKDYYKRQASEYAASTGDVSLHHSKWINTPDGSGLMLIGSNGKPFYALNGKPYGFTFAQSVHPGLIPGYNEYHNESWLKRWI